MGFASDISAWCDKVKGRGAAVLRGVALEAVGRVQELTPVRTGYLRANWSAVAPGDAVPSPGSPSQAALERAVLGDTILVVNPVEYARAVEFGGTGTDVDGALRHRPGRGMVQQTLAELPAIADGVVERVKRS